MIEKPDADAILRRPSRERKKTSWLQVGGPAAGLRGRWTIGLRLSCAIRRMRRACERMGSLQSTLADCGSGLETTCLTMADLPTGTVTFLFSDVEGSTRLWEEHPETMRNVLARHDALAAAVIDQYGGILVKSRGEGDSLFCVFALASDATAAVLALQLALTREPWPAETPLRVRMALHTGEPTPRDGDYYGPPVNRCARLRAIAHGGQVLLSDVTHDLGRDSLPPGVSLKPLGEHRLKDLGRPETVFQLCHPDLPFDFPALRSLDQLPNNLPVQVTSFVGREHEIGEVKRLLGSTSLLTLTGSGGSGKTRLALQAAADLLEDSGDGVWLVELASLTDPILVPQSVVSVLGMRVEPGVCPTRTVTEYLKSRHLILILDNCEHLLGACAQLTDALIRSCPRVKVLCTSREGLGIAGETTYRVPSLSLPGPKDDLRIEALSQYEAVRLFIDRALAAVPGFSVTNRNAPALASVCSRLDGIPLAIELAAARVAVLPVETINERLDNRFRLLTCGSRTALPRQQTLRALIDWSYDLLSASEQVLLRRLAVFAGGWTLDAGEAACAGEPIDEGDVLDVLTALVEKSLVIYEEADERYRLLETVRQYARERLLNGGEVEAVRSRHLDFFARLAEEAKAQLGGPSQAVWLDRLEADHDNLRAALDWSAELETSKRASVWLARYGDSGWCGATSQKGGSG